MRNKLPSKKKIWDYWFNILLKDKPNYAYCYDEISCFACAKTSGLERCHIVAHIDGGDECVSNLHLLCASCHSDTEGVYKLNPVLYYAYLRFKRHWFEEKADIIYRMYDLK
jgi:5-methylcytosine-specific restriction endonuclease McrA